MFRHRLRHAEPAVAREGANFDDPLCPEKLNQKGHELPLLRCNLHPAHFLLCGDGTQLAHQVSLTN